MNNGRNHRSEMPTANAAAVIDREKERRGGEEKEEEMELSSAPK